MHTKIAATTASQKLNVSPFLIKRWIQHGKLNSEKIGGKWYALTDDLFAQHLHSNGEYVHSSDAQHLHTQIEMLTKIVNEKDRRNSDVEKQISEKDKQIGSLLEQLDHQSQLLAVAHKSLRQVSEQYQLVTDDRKRPFWKRIFGK